MDPEKNIYEDGLTKIWLQDAPEEQVEAHAGGVTVSCELAGVKGTQLHERAVMDQPSSGNEGEVGIYRIMEL